MSVFKYKKWYRPDLPKQADEFDQIHQPVLLDEAIQHDEIFGHAVILLSCVGVFSGFVRLLRSNSKGHVLRHVNSHLQYVHSSYQK